MNRRKFGLLAGSSLAALNLNATKARAAADPSLLTTTLTPMGGERAGNADGSIPAWTGGYTTIPDGWQPGTTMPDFFADDKPVVVINAANMAQYADKLSEGVMAMMTKYGFYIKVFPTHRTAAAPQDVYDHIASNVTTATLSPAGPQFGFANAFGGIPFAIPDVSDPLTAGPQLMWNHLARWQGRAALRGTEAWAVNGGQLALSDYAPTKFLFEYYAKGGSISTFDGLINKQITTFVGPQNLVGEELVGYYSTNTLKQPNILWELLNGQGRVRKAPELSYDTPSEYADGNANYDEYYGFNGALDRYDWKYVGKKELYIPYNNNAMYLQPAQEVHKAHFMDPELVRWELHRVWVIDATVRSGARNVLARRRLYLDEDTFIVSTADAWDANNDLYHINISYKWVRPDLPGTIYGDNSILNVQTGDYATVSGEYNQKVHPDVTFVDSYPESIFDPLNMAANAQY